MRNRNCKGKILIFLGLLVILFSDVHSNIYANLQWDKQYQEVIVSNTNYEARFTFVYTNQGNSSITVRNISTSCGCTTIVGPATPFTILPGQTGYVEVVTDIYGKEGELHKLLVLDTTEGFNVLSASVIIKKELSSVANTNYHSAPASDKKPDGYAIFKGECVKCHVTPAVGKTGSELYNLACGICHNTNRRATMVPDLKETSRKHDLEWWRAWIIYGKTNSLMPGFSKVSGGPLDEGQIESLLEFVKKEFMPEEK